MSNLRLLLRRFGWSKPAFIALAVGLAPSACVAETSLQAADLPLQLAQSDGARPAPPPTISSPYGAYLAGLVAQADGDLEVAADYMLQALRYDPDNPDLLYPALQLVAAVGRQKDAVNLARRALGRESHHSLATLVLVAEAASQGNLPEAEALLSALPERGFDQLLVPMLMSWVKAGQGDVDGGLESLAVLKSQAGTSVLYAIHAALVNEVYGRNEAASMEYDVILEGMAQPTLRVTWLAGSFLERSGERERAIALYRSFAGSSAGSEILLPLLESAEKGVVTAPEIASATDGMAEVLFNLAGLLSQENADDAALVHLHQALVLRPDFPIAQVLLAEILQKQGRSREAIAAYRGIPKDSPFSWLVRLRIADELRVMDDNEAALAELDLLAAERPDSFEPLARKGQILSGEERFAEAVEAYDLAFERILAIEPEHWSLLYFRGIALERSDQWERAEADFKQALGLQPEQPYVMNYLAYSWVEKKQNLDEAEAMLERAVKLRPRDGYIVDSLGWVYYRLGRYDEAVVQLERAVELRPQDPTINDHLGDALWQVGRRHEARFQWHRALSLDPEEDQRLIIEDKIEDGMQVPPKDI